MNEEIKIKTPYGYKNWSFVKMCIENHEQLTEALNYCVLYSDNQEKVIRIASQAIKQTKESKQ